MILKRIYRYLLLIGLALIFSACAGINPPKATAGSLAASQQAQSTTPTIPGAVSGLLTQQPARSTASITPELNPTELSANRTPSISTPQVPGSPNEWSTYSSGTQPPFSFEYPSLYDSAAYSACKITQESSANYLLYLRFGYRSELAVARNDLQSLDSYVERWRQGMDIESENYQTINGLQGVTIDYRFGGTNRFGSSTFINQDDLIYIFNFTAGGTCDLAEINLNEITIFNHAIETFKLGATSP
jgi:hypothetical protein